jgi:hypothetical protein
MVLLSEAVDRRAERPRQHGAIGGGKDQKPVMSFRQPCGSSVPRLDGAFCSMDVAIDDLKERTVTQKRLRE